MGYHMYKNLQNFVEGKGLATIAEPGNINDKFAVAIIKKEVVQSWAKYMRQTPVFM